MSDIEAKLDIVFDKALALFRVLNGTGDSGSRINFYCMNSAVKQGWLRLAQREIDLEAQNAVQVEALRVDAERYRFLRDDENWGEDSGEDNWEALAESAMCTFDKVVDSRKAKMEAILLPPTEQAKEG